MVGLIIQVLCILVRSYKLKPIYEEITVTTAGTDSKILKRIDEDGSIWWIPMDEANSDYQAYLASLEAPTV